MACGGSWYGLWNYARAATRRGHDPSDRTQCLLNPGCRAAVAGPGKIWYDILIRGKPAKDTMLMSLLPTKTGQLRANQKKAMSTSLLTTEPFISLIQPEQPDP